MTIEDKLGGENKGLEQSVNASYEPQAVPERITDIYFKPKSFERSCRVYRWLGVPYFKKILMGTIGKLRKKGEPNTYRIGKDRSIDSLLDFETATRLNETAHAIIAPFCAYFSYLDFATDPEKGIAFAIGAVLNFYIVMLQRYNRARIYNTLEGTEGPKVWTGKTPE